MTAGNFLNHSFGLTTVFLLPYLRFAGWARRRWLVLRLKKTWVTRIAGFWHNPGLPMTKTELQNALAEATPDRQTNGG
jgi:hypothetical protein